MRYAHLDSNEHKATLFLSSNHHLFNLDMSVYVSYVAKEQDSTGQSLESSRACHVVHCEDLDQANKMYNAFETAFNKNNRATLKVKQSNINDKL